MKKAVFALVLLSMFIIPLTSQAAEEANRFYLSPFVGGMTFDGSKDLETSPLIGLRGGYNLTKNWAVEALFQYIAAETDDIDWNATECCGSGSKSSKDVDIYRYGVNLVYNFMPDSKLIPFLTVGVGGMTLDGPDAYDFNETDPTVDFGGGLKYYFNDNWAIRGDIRDVVRFDSSTSNLEYTLGISYLFGGEKEKAPAEEVVVNSDCDNVPDNLDKCPATPCGCNVDQAGCPIDTDKDGVCDGLDKCVGTPVGCVVDKDGCPVDEDKDGVCDGLDKCPGTLLGCVVDEKGCPVDTDKDGVCDGLDKCPGTLLGCIVDKDGCPIDSDKDGVCDGLDKCPGTPVGVKVDEYGCPEFVKKTITLNVKFDTDKTTIKKEFNKELKELADFMKAYPDTKTTIEGHTDSVGSDKYNMGLSQRRADAVRKALIEQYGVAADRLTTAAYGESKPIATNATAQGRYQNRMVRATIEKVVPKKK